MKKFIAKITYRFWHPLVMSAICQLCPLTINSRQLHEILARLDRTQKKHFRLWKQ